MLNLKFKVRVGGIRNESDRLIGWTAHQLDTGDLLLLFLQCTFFSSLRGTKKIGEKRVRAAKVKLDNDRWQALLLFLQ